MASKRTANGPIKSRVNEARTEWAAFAGAGAAAIVVAPAATMRTQDNYATALGGVSTVITRNGVGDHTITFPESMTRVLFVAPQTSGTTALQADVTTQTINVNNTLTVRVLTSTPAGVATDMATTDVLRLRIDGSDSGV